MKNPYPLSEPGYNEDSRCSGVTPTNPTPPTNASESTEPKVQVTEADNIAARQVVYSCTSSNNQLLTENWEERLIRLRRECLRIIAPHRTSAVEAARAEWQEEHADELAMLALGDKHSIEAMEYIRKAEGLINSYPSPFERTWWHASEKIRLELQAELSRVREELEAQKNLAAETTASHGRHWKKTLDELTTERAEHAKVKAELVEAKRRGDHWIEAHDRKQATLTAEQQAHQKTADLADKFIELNERRAADYRALQAQLDQARAEAGYAITVCEGKRKAVADWMSRADKAESSLVAVEKDRERLVAAAERAEGMIRGEFHRFNFDPAWAATLGELQRAIKTHHTASSDAQGEK